MAFTWRAAAAPSTKSTSAPGGASALSGVSFAALFDDALSREGIDNVVLEKRSREYVEKRVRAGVIEFGIANLIEEAGAGERLLDEIVLLVALESGQLESGQDVLADAHGRDRVRLHGRLVVRPGGLAESGRLLRCGEPSDSSGSESRYPQCRRK